MKKIFYIIVIGIFLIIGILFSLGNGEKFGKNSENFDLHISENMVEIITQNHNNILQKSSGYRISPEIVLASAHAVNENMKSISINEKKFFIIGKNEHEDFVLLSENMNANIAKNIFQNSESDEVFTFVYRSGKWEKIFGNITGKNIEITAIMPNGKIEKIFVKYLTDLAVQVGDSGSPIFDKNYNIIDIVHIAK